MRISEEEKERSIKVLEDLIRDIKKESMHIMYVGRHRSVRETTQPMDEYRSYEPTGEISITIQAIEKPPIDKSDKADAERFRWILKEQVASEGKTSLSLSTKDPDIARKEIDKWIATQLPDEE